jgi:adenylate kinase
MTRTEQVLQRVLDVLYDNLVDIIDGESSVYNDCPLPEGYYFGLPDLRRVSAMPIVAVELDSETLATRTLGGVGVGRRERVVPVLVVIAHAHREEERLMRQLIQLCDAVVQVLERASQDNFWLIQEAELVDFSPPIEGEQSMPFVRYASVRVVVQVRHTRGEAG